MITKFRLSALWLVCLAFVALASCQRTDFPDNAGPYFETAALEGNWKLEQVIQVDEDAVSKGFPDSVSRLDITPLHNFAGYTINMASENGEPKGGFSVNNPNASPVMLPEGGNWALDFTSSPAIKVTASADDTTGVMLALRPAYRKTDNRLALRVTRFSGAKALNSYIYFFTR